MPISTLPPEPSPSAHERAQPPRFGEAGQFAVIAGSSIGISSSSYSNSNATAFGVHFEPSFEYFVLQDFSIGLEADFAYTNDKSYEPDGLFASRYTLMGGGVHVGLNVPFGRSFSFYPLLSVGVHHVVQEYELLNASRNAFSPEGARESLTRTGLWLSLSAPLLYHPVEHFFVGVGPLVYHDFSHASGGWSDGSGVPRTNVGGTFVLGGYFDFEGTAPPPEGFAPAGTEPPERRRFGERGTVVLTEETGFSWRSMIYSGAVPSRSSFAISGAFDWFVARNVSLGLAVAYEDRTNIGFPPGPVTSEREGVGAGLRLGFVLPFYSWFSVWGRMSFEYTTSSIDVVSGDFPRKTRDHVLAASISVPAMAQLAPHFFVGFGPSVSEDLVHSHDVGPETKRLAYGARTLIGGWL